jgi:hypothetical protein
MRRRYANVQKRVRVVPPFVASLARKLSSARTNVCLARGWRPRTALSWRSHRWRTEQQSSRTCQCGAVSMPCRLSTCMVVKGWQQNVRV